MWGVIYCVSDIHGELDKYERMLELIRFSDSDQMYIIGDVIDRGAMGVDVLRKIMDAPNMTMLLGNHEQMCLDRSAYAFAPKSFGVLKQ